MRMTRRDVWVGMLLYPRHTLPTAAAPVLVAVGLARSDGLFHWPAAVAAFVAGWMIQLGGVFTDNYTNLSRHPDDAEHADFVLAVATGLISLAEIRQAILFTYALGALSGAYLAWLGGVPAIVIGVASVLASLTYSTGPFPLGDRALGDPLFFLFFGIVSVVGSYYVQAAAVLSPPFPLWPPMGSIAWPAFVASLPIAALTTNILVIDNIRDREYDRAKHEWTLAVLIGRRGSHVEYLALVALAYAVPVALWLAGAGRTMLLPLVTLPYAIATARRVLRASSHEAMIPLTPQAGQVLLAFAVFFALGLAWH